MNFLWINCPLLVSECDKIRIFLALHLSIKTEVVMTVNHIFNFTENLCIYIHEWQYISAIACSPYLPYYILIIMLVFVSFLRYISIFIWCFCIPYFVSHVFLGTFLFGKDKLYLLFSSLAINVILYFVSYFTYYLCVCVCEGGFFFI